jgi:hypothetical protein
LAAAELHAQSRLMDNADVLLGRHALEDLLTFDTVGQAKGDLLLRKGRHHDTENGQSMVAGLEPPRNVHRVRRPHPQGVGFQLGDVQQCFGKGASVPFPPATTGRASRATKRASLGSDANTAQRAELRRLWTSLSSQARAELWTGHKDDLLAAGLLAPTVKKAAPDRGSGPHGAEEPGAEDRRVREKMNLIAEAADWKGDNDVSRHMAHYLGNSGTDMELPVDRMMSDVPDFRSHIEGRITAHQDAWREQALAEFRRNGGQPVAIPVETSNRDFSFAKGINENWFFAVGSTRSNVTGVVTVVPDASGDPKVGLDYQANAWDRYNWDESKAVTIDLPGGGDIGIPDGRMARLHTTGIAQEFDMAGSSSVKHYDLGGSAPSHGPLPAPDEPGREGDRTDPDREQQEAR